MSTQARPLKAGGSLDDGSPVVEILRIAAPAMVTMLSYVVMQFVDTLIVSRLGPGSVAAVGNGGIFAFVLAAFMFGLLGIINTYVSQNYGAGKPERGAAYAWNGLWLSVLVWLFIMLPIAAVLPQIFAAISTVLDGRSGGGGIAAVDRASVMAAAVSYGRVSIIGMVVVLSARGLAHYFYGMHRAKWVMVAAIVGNLVNIPVSIALVFGMYGLPRLEVAGAAVGTVIGSSVEMLILLAIFVGPKFNHEFATRAGWKFSRKHVRDLFRLGWPAGVMFGNELVCWWIFMSMIVASFGVAHNDAAWIGLRYMHVSFMPAVGLSMAVTAVVGKMVGAGRMDLAGKRMLLGLSMAMTYMGACALAMVIFREPLVALFAERMDSGAGAEAALHVERVIAIGSRVLVVAAAFQIFDATAITIVGALRGAGDTVWPGIVTALCSWVFIIGGGLLTARFLPQLGSLGPWMGAAGFIIALALALTWRWRSGVWQRMAVVEREPVVPAAPGTEMGCTEFVGAESESAAAAAHDVAEFMQPATGAPPSGDHLTPATARPEVEVKLEVEDRAGRA